MLLEPVRSAFDDDRWQAYIAGSAALVLPADRRFELPDRDSAEVTRVLTQPATVAELAARLDTDAATVLLAAAGALFARYADRDEVTFGVIDASGPGWLRATTSGDPSFSAFVDAIASERLQTRGWSLTREALDAAGFVVAQEPFDGELPAPVLTLADGVLRLRYDGRLLRETSAQRLLGHLETLLASVTDDPQAPLSTRTYLTAAEREAIVVDWNATDRPFDEDALLHDLFERWVRERPEKVAIVDNMDETTYAQLHERADGIAAALQEAGVAAGDVVGICLERGPDAIATLLAILRAGAAFLPLDRRAPAARHAVVLEDAGVRVIVADRGYVPHDTTMTTLAIENIGPGTPRRVRVSPDALAYIEYTSGSTGKPKGVEIEHRGLVAMCAWTRNHFRDEILDGFLNATQLGFDVAMFEIFGAICNGGTVYLAENVLAVGDLLGRDRIKLFSSTTAGLVEVLRAGMMPSSVEVVMQAGEYLPARVARDVYETTDAQQLINLCGATEDTVYSVEYPVPRDVYDDPPIGKPFENRRAYILDRFRSPMPVGIPGELCYAGVGVARGYRNLKDRTATTFVPNPFATGRYDERLYRTGDRARFDEDGNIVFIGRLDNQVKIRGFRIELGEVEAVLAAHPAVDNAIVVAYEAGDDKRLGAFLLANTVRPDEEIVAYLREHLPTYMVPTAFEWSRTMPTNENGKADRAAIAERFAKRGESVAAATQQTTSAKTSLSQRVLGELAAGLLGVEHLDVDENFFEAGGHSLLAARFIADVEKHFGMRRLLPTFLAQPTLRALAAAIELGRGIDARGVYEIVKPRTANPPMFYFHGMFDSEGFYVWNIAKHLDSEDGFYVIPPHGNDGTPPPTSIEAMAADRLREIRSIQPNGPYRLGGFCNGGLVAYHVAALLRSQGEEVQQLVIVSASVTHRRFKPMRALVEAAGKRLGLAKEKRVDLFRRLVLRALQIERIAVDGQRRRLRSPKAMMKVARERLVERSERIAIVNAFGLQPSPFQDRYLGAVLTYEPPRYDRPVTLVWGRESVMEGFNHPSLGWGDVAKVQAVHRIPGGHFAVVERPDRLAQIIREAPRT